MADRPLHYAGDLQFRSGRTAVTQVGSGFAACCSGDRAYAIRRAGTHTHDRTQVTLRELCETRPLEHGLAELVAYLQLAGDSFKSVIDEGVSELIVWRGAGPDGKEYVKQARLARGIFVSG